MVDVKHTPGPREIMLTAHGHTIVSREHGWSVASLPDYDPTHEANAAFIVKAVNAHDELVAALRLARRHITVHRNDFDEVINDTASDDLAIIDAALAKVDA
jgi:hypothetical protein